jgi:hypothetical protein
MFYSQLLMAKKGPLARIWLAAHWDRKLDKKAIAQTDVKKTAGASSNFRPRAGPCARAAPAAR